MVKYLGGGGGGGVSKGKHVWVSVSKEVHVWGVSVQWGTCLGCKCPMGVHVWGTYVSKGVYFWGVSVQGGTCLGCKCPRGYMSGV